MEMVIRSKEVEELRYCGAEWSIHVNIKSGERMKPCLVPQRVTASPHCARSIL